MILNEYYTLSNGVKIPKIGYGTWLIEDKKTGNLVKEALNLGYRHIDTAQAYQNERGVGEGLRLSDVSREDIFVTTKIEGDIKNYQDAVDSIKESLEKLQLDYIDLMIIHSPQPWSEFRQEKSYDKENLAVWKALEEAYEAGIIKAIGVSNFLEKDLDNLIKNAKIKPMVNQILTHISNTPFDLIQYCQENDILVEAYSPVAHGEIMKNKDIIGIAQKYKVSVPQLGIRYCLQLGTLPLPKSETPAHIASNAKLDFEISSEDMTTLKALDKISDYGEADFFPVYNKK